MERVRLESSSFWTAVKLGGFIRDAECCTCVAPPGGEGLEPRLLEGRLVEAFGNCSLNSPREDNGGNIICCLRSTPKRNTQTYQW